MEPQCRISVRLDPGRAALVQKLGRETNSSVTDIIKRGLDELAALDSTSTPPAALRERGVVVASCTNPHSQPVALSNPPKLNELMPYYRASGGCIWEERRRLFHRLFAAASAAMEHDENPRDLELFNLLLGIGRKYNLFD
jgi:hypothetical protein